MTNRGFTTPGPTFTARYGSACASCSERIQVGDHCRWVDDQAAHADCDRTPTAPKTPDAPPCIRCFMVPAVNGACGCDPDNTTGGPTSP